MVCSDIRTRTRARRGALEAGTRLGPYAVEREVGRGGMGTVYLARADDGAEVALKVLQPEIAVALAPARFQREIRLASRLRHPHLVPVLDSGETDGRLWLTMPYVAGETLRDRIRRDAEELDADVRALLTPDQARRFDRIRAVERRQLEERLRERGWDGRDGKDRRSGRPRPDAPPPPPAD